MIKLLSAAFLMTVLTVHGAFADTVYERLEKRYAEASLPGASDIHKNMAWTGKCVDFREPMLLRNAALFASFVEEPLLGGFFYITPLYNLLDAATDYGTVRDRGNAMIASGVITSTVGMEPTTKNYLVRYKDSARNNTATTMYLRSAKDASGKVMLVSYVEPDYYSRPPTPPRYSSYYYDAKPYVRPSPDKYCYFYDEKGSSDGSSVSGGDPVVPPPL